MIILHEYIKVKKISKKKGKGAFAKKPIEKDTIIDIAFVIPISNKDYAKVSDTILYDYFYIWEDPMNMPEYNNAIALSISQFINHSYQPNLKYLYDYKKKAIEFSSIRDISQGEELTVNYNGLVDDNSPVWFEAE